jgi:hypothetical protein
MTCITVFITPADVNSWAYVIGAEHQDTFNPVSYGKSCVGGGRFGGGCHTVTEGYLSQSGADVSWGSPVPLGQPFSPHDPSGPGAPAGLSPMAKPADAGARWRGSGQSPANTSSRPRSPRKRRSPPCTPQERQALTMAWCSHVHCTPRVPPRACLIRL